MSNVPNDYFDLNFTTTIKLSKLITELKDRGYICRMVASGTLRNSERYGQTISFAAGLKWASVVKK